MNTDTQPVHGVVGIFDALGAKNFTHDQVSSYVDSQNQILAAVEHKASGQMESRNLNRPKLFTFNDTIVIALETDRAHEYTAIKGFAKIVRRFISYSLTKALFFRGAFSVGPYVVREDQNLIMGAAVTDAASWYEQPELIGAVATPKASMVIKSHVLRGSTPPDFVLFEAKIPCKTGATKLYSVNWPKAFYVEGLRPRTCTPGNELSCLLDLLVANEVPIGTEQKYSNTVEFFDQAPCQSSGEE